MTTVSEVTVGQIWQSKKTKRQFKIEGFSYQLHTDIWMVLFTEIPNTAESHIYNVDELERLKEWCELSA